jgi:hypothetical protein
MLIYLKKDINFLLKFMIIKNTYFLTKGEYNPILGYDFTRHTEKGGV